MAKKTIEEILASKPSVKSSGGILSGLFRKIMQEEKLIPQARILIDKYMRDEESKNKKNELLGKRFNNKTKAQITGNITADDMSWKTFCDLLANYLKINRVTITITLEHSKDKSTTHSINAITRLDDDYDDNDIESLTKNETKEIKDGE